MQKVEILDTEENTDNEGKQFSEAEPENEIEKPLIQGQVKWMSNYCKYLLMPRRLLSYFQRINFTRLVNGKSRQLLRLFDEFMELLQGKMPLGIKRVRKPNRQRKEMDSRKAALRLIKFEKDLVSDKVNKKKKRKWKSSL